MGHDDVPGLVSILVLLANFRSVLPVCNQGFSQYLQFKGLRLDVAAPHENQQEVSYSCDANRAIPGHSAITSTCIGNT